ncbi:hypothetical protein BS78_07G147500 [Paspalum vaginatum]|nr:hypothetical protein BS78_07G147500 [Paspalum vaginatum]
MVARHHRLLPAAVLAFVVLSLCLHRLPPRRDHARCRYSLNDRRTPPEPLLGSDQARRRCGGGGFWLTHSLSSAHADRAARPRAAPSPSPCHARHGSWWTAGFLSAHALEHLAAAGAVVAAEKKHDGRRRTSVSSGSAPRYSLRSSPGVLPRDTSPGATPPRRPAHATPPLLR